MRNFLVRTALCMGLICFICPAHAATTPSVNTTDPAPPVMSKLASLSLREAQQLAGRRFTFKEKIGFWLLKKEIKKGEKKGFSKTIFSKVFPKKGAKGDTPGSKGQAALVFGIAAIVILVLGFFIPYIVLVSPIAAILAIVLGTIAKKKDPDDTKGKIGKLLGWISLGLFVALIIAVAIALSGWGF